MKNYKVNYGIALALFGILVFSLMNSVEGFKEGSKTKSKPVGKNKAAKIKNVFKKA